MLYLWSPKHGRWISNSKHHALAHSSRASVSLSMLVVTICVCWWWSVMCFTAYDLGAHIVVDKVCLKHFTFSVELEGQKKYQRDQKKISSRRWWSWGWKGKLSGIHGSEINMLSPLNPMDSPLTLRSLPSSSFFFSNFVADLTAR